MNLDKHDKEVDALIDKVCLWGVWWLVLGLLLVLVSVEPLVYVAVPAWLVAGVRLKDYFKAKTAQKG